MSWNAFPGQRAKGEGERAKRKSSGSLPFALRPWLFALCPLGDSIQLDKPAELADHHSLFTLQTA